MVQCASLRTRTRNGHHNRRVLNATEFLLRCRASPRVVRRICLPVILILNDLLGISASTECEFQLQDNPVCYRLAVFRCRLELRLTRRFDCLFGKSIW